jgi:ectoine hydroxylase-related dioxygenase (phytanoyl-CoA dioxygenase family)
MATALERRGVRATYRLHDTVLTNRASRRSFKAERPALDELQQRIVTELEADGYSLLTFHELFSDEEWQAVQEQAARFVAETEAGLAGDRESLRVRAGKEFVVRLHSYDVEVGLDDAWFRACASRRMLDIANTYLGLWSKLEYVDMWYSVPQPADADRISSQRWHRDFNDKHLLKAFLYLVDVDEDTGPFQYVPGSAPGGRYADAWPWKPLGENYPPENELEKRIPDDGVRTFTGPKGTFLFCNTSGFHRGGFATGKARVLATCTYSSPASLAALTERSYRYTGSLEELDAVTRFALT